MDCSEAQKVHFGMYILAEEADDWWVETRQRLIVAGEVITRVVFSREFFRKYFPEDGCGKKEIEFLQLEQGDSTVIEYALKFVELDEQYPYYNGAKTEFSKCIKSKMGLRSEIKWEIGY